MACRVDLRARGAVAVTAVAVGCLGLVAAEPNGLGLTPPMGWNPYNRMKSSGFKWVPNERIVRAQAAALESTGLRKLGYKYVNLDAGWSLRDRDNVTGRVRPDPVLYPNIANGKDAKTCIESVSPLLKPILNRPLNRV